MYQANYDAGRANRTATLGARERSPSEALAILADSSTLAWEAERTTDYSAFNPRRAALVAMYLHEPLGAES